MNTRRHVLLALLAGSAVLAGCASPQVSDYAQQRPKLELDRYFNGRIRAHGIFQKRGGEVVRSFRVALGRQPRGAKVYEGDGKTPEGLYWLDALKPDSRFYKAIRISYPNRSDRDRARHLGKSAGGAIMVHGVPDDLLSWGADHYLFNWTEGCIAVTNDEMDVIWNSVRLGTPIEILP